MIVSPESSEDWNNIVRLESGGGAPSSYFRHTFKGEHCVKQQRMPANKVPEGKKYLAGEFTFQDGIPPEPRKQSEMSGMQIAGKDGSAVCYTRAS